MYAAPVVILIISGASWGFIPCPLNRWLDWRWEQESIHSAIEAVGALTAILMAMFLFLRPKEQLNRKTFYSALGFLTMGLLYMFIIVVPVGQAFVMLHRLGGLLGGLGFALVWLPESTRYARWTKPSYIIVTLVTAALGSAIVIFQDKLPVVLVDGSFTPTAKFIATAASICFLAGAVRLILDYRRTKKTEDYLFFLMALLFGLAGWSFKYSDAWSGKWWFWHYLQMGAFLLAFGYIIYSQHRAEQLLQRSLRAVRVLSESNQTLVRAATEMELLNKACRIAVETGGYKLAWAGYAMTDESKSIKPVAQFGFEAGYLENLKLTYAEDETKCGPSCRALRSGRPYICKDVHTDENFAPWRYQALKRGYNSTIALPLTINNQTFGVLRIYAPEPNAFDEEEVKLLEELAGDLSFGISLFRTSEGRQLAERKLQKSEEQFHTMVEHSHDVIIQIDNMGNIVFANHRAEELTGYKLAEWKGRYFVQAIAPSDHSKSQNLFLRVLNGETVQDEINILKADGTKVALSVRTTPIMEGDNVTGMVSFGEDVTEQIKLRAQLVQAQKMESIGRLAGGIAHDFNNLMTAVQGHAHMALEEVSPDTPLAKHLNQISNVISRATNLTRQLLIFSRKSTVNLKPININERITEMLKMLGRLIGEEVTIETNLAKDIWTVRADGANMEQVLMNLSLNARDAMAEGGQLTLKTENITLDTNAPLVNAEAKPGRYVCISVIDTGCGMTDEIQGRLFEPFFTTKEQGKGTGLGLSVVYGIIKQHGGFITVSSVSGMGSIFKIYLPAIAEKPLKDASTIALLQTTALLMGRGERILLVEDDNDVRQFAQTLLNKNGYKVTASATPSEAISIFEREQGRFDLVFTDVGLPEMNGIQLVNRLKVTRADLRVLFSSGYMEKDLILPTGLPFIPKPYPISDLLKTIREVLMEKR